MMYCIVYTASSRIVCETNFNYFNSQLVVKVTDAKRFGPKALAGYRKQ